MLTEEGNEFARAYFDFDHGEYMEVLARGLPSHYHVQDARENYTLLKERIDQRYVDWRRTRQT